ncbi:unnamed protein product, partial [Callosobruchus maculatus]
MEEYLAEDDEASRRQRMNSRECGHVIFNLFYKYNPKINKIN